MRRSEEPQGGEWRRHGDAALGDYKREVNTSARHHNSHLMTKRATQCWAGWGAYRRRDTGTQQDVARLHPVTHNGMQVETHCLVLRVLHLVFADRRWPPVTGTAGSETAGKWGLLCVHVCEHVHTERGTPVVAAPHLHSLCSFPPLQLSNQTTSSLLNHFLFAEN